MEALIGWKEEVIINSTAKKTLETEENKSHSVIGVSKNNVLLGFILLGDVLEDSISSVHKLEKKIIKLIF